VAATKTNNTKETARAMAMLNPSPLP